MQEESLLSSNASSQPASPAASPLPHSALPFLQDVFKSLADLFIVRLLAIILSNDIKKSIQGNLQLLRLDSFALKIYAFFHQSLFFF